MAFIDALTEEEDLKMVALDAAMLEAETCELEPGDRVLLDRGETSGGFGGGRVMGMDSKGRVSVQLDGEASERYVDRPALLKALAPTVMVVKQLVKVAFEHEDLPSGSMRWQFGTINRVHPGGELIDISYENGDESIGIPTYDVECV